MYRQDALEAAPLIQRVLVYLNKIIPPSGRPGSDARTAIGDLYVNVYALLIADALGAPLDNVFDLVQQAGATYGAFGAVRDRIELEAPTTLGGNLARNLCIDWCLTMQGVCISGMTFTSRSQVEQVIAALQQPFYNAEEIAADSMDQMTFQNLIAFARVDHKSSRSNCAATTANDRLPICRRAADARDLISALRRRDSRRRGPRRKRNRSPGILPNDRTSAQSLNRKKLQSSSSTVSNSAIGKPSS